MSVVHIYISNFRLGSKSEHKMSERNELYQVLPCPNSEEAFVTLYCRATVIDPICELSHQKIVLPATPVTSFSYASVHLRCI